jgi:preprotein translocase subunit SecB
MDAASFNVDREAFAASFPPPQKPSATISGRHSVVNRKPDSFVVIVEYVVSVIGSSGAEVVNITCKYSASFSIEKETDQACIERFAGNEVQLVFWPYLRHFISDCTYRMAIFPLVLPLTSEIAALKS